MINININRYETSIIVTGFSATSPRPSGNITNLHGSCVTKGRKALQRLIKTAQNIMCASTKHQYRWSEMSAQRPKDTRTPTPYSLVWKKIQMYTLPYQSNFIPGLWDSSIHSLVLSLSLHCISFCYQFCKMTNKLTLLSLIHPSLHPRILSVIIIIRSHFAFWTSQAPSQNQMWVVCTVVQTKWNVFSSYMEGHHVSFTSFSCRVWLCLCCVVLLTVRLTDLTSSWLNVEIARGFGDCSTWSRHTHPCLDVILPKDMCWR